MKGEAVNDLNGNGGAEVPFLCSDLDQRLNVNQHVHSRNVHICDDVVDSFANRAASHHGYYDIGVVTFYGTTVCIPVSAKQSVASLRRQIAAIPECADGSPAWTINGWSLPKILLGKTLLKDSDRLIDVGVCPGCTLQPVYDSSCYLEPIIDLDFYGGGGQLDTSAFSDQMPDVCASVKQGGENVHRGITSMLDTIRTSTGLESRCLAGGVGIAPQQDDATLCFRITHVAPASPAEHHGVQVGDVILAVDGVACVDGAGLDSASRGRLRALAASAAAAEREAGWFSGWWSGGGGGDVGDGRAIAAPEDLRRALAGLPGSWVRLRLRKGEGGGGSESGKGWGSSADGGRVVEVDVQRKGLTLYAGEYL